MGITYPQFNISATIQNIILDVLEKTIREHYPTPTEKITSRPIRPNEINTALTIDNRKYSSAVITQAACHILDAAAAITVPTGITFLMVGWIVICNDPEVVIEETLTVTTHTTTTTYPIQEIEYIEGTTGDSTGGCKIITAGTVAQGECKVTYATGVLLFHATDNLTACKIRYRTYNKDSIGSSAVLTVEVNDVLKSELSAWLVEKSPGHMLLTLDQIVVATENSKLAFKIRAPDGDNAANAIVYPLCYKIGPASQLDVS